MSQIEIRIAIIIIGLLVSLVPYPAMADGWGPWEASATSPNPPSLQAGDPFDRAIRNFQKYISPLDGARCPMYPTCSAYARQALHKHGALLGVFMTADRLMHEGDPVEQQEPLLKWGHRRYFDPLEKNNYWLNSQE